MSVAKSWLIRFTEEIQVGKSIYTNGRDLPGSYICFIASSIQFHHLMAYSKLPIFSSTRVEFKKVLLGKIELNLGSYPNLGPYSKLSKYVFRSFWARFCLFGKKQGLLRYLARLKGPKIWWIGSNNKEVIIQNFGKRNRGSFSGYIITLQGTITYPSKIAFWRWFSFSQGGIC